MVNHLLRGYVSDDHVSDDHVSDDYVSDDHVSDDYVSDDYVPGTPELKRSTRPQPSAPNLRCLPPRTRPEGRAGVHPHVEVGASPQAVHPYTGS